MAKILIIEDDKIVSEMYALKFKNAGHEVEEAIDGLKGLTKLAEYKPDAILLDIMMPSMNGFETLEAIRNQTSSNCKIIMFTNVIDKEKLEKSLEYGADDYLIKANTNPSDAVEKVESMLETSHENVYVEPGINNFKMKNPNGGDDIDVSVNIEV